jgi:hypothetical protein
LSISDIRRVTQFNDLYVGSGGSGVRFTADLGDAITRVGESTNQLEKTGGMGGIGRTREVAPWRVR